MEDYLSLQLERQEANRAKRAAIALQEAKLKALQDTIGNYGNFRYVNLNDFIDPDNQNWNDYKWSRLPAFESAKRQEHINAGTPVGMLIQQIRDAKNTDDVKKQLEVWNSYKPLDSSDNGTSYIRYFIPGFGAYRNTPSIGNRPIQTIAGGTGGAQGGVAVDGTQGTQTGNTGGSTGTQGMKTGNTGSAQTGGTGTGSTGGMRAGNSGSTGGSYATPGQPTGGTYSTPKPTPMHNPDNVSLAYSLRNTPISPEMQRQALIDKWNQEHGISYATGKDGLIYRTDPQHPNGYVDPFKNDLSKTGSTGYATGQGMLTSGSNGTYATGEGIKDANGNVLTNPGGDWEYQYALKNPQYGLGMTSKMSDAQKNYLQAVSDDMGFNYNFKGAPRYV